MFEQPAPLSAGIGARLSLRIPFGTLYIYRHSISILACNTNFPLLSRKPIYVIMSNSFLLDKLTVFTKLNTDGNTFYFKTKC